MIVTLHELFHELLIQGCHSCLLRTQFDIALSNVPDDDIPRGLTWGLYVQLVAQHIRICFGFLRVLVIEDENANKPGYHVRQYAKTNKFRKSCQYGDTAIINVLKKLVKVPSLCNLPNPSTPTPSTRAPRSFQGCTDSPISTGKCTTVIATRKHHQ